MSALYIDQGLRPYVVPLEQHFPPWQSRAHFGRATIKTTWLLCHDFLLDRANTWLNIGGVRFKDDLMKSKQGRQWQLNVVHPSSRYRLVFLSFINPSMYRRCVAVINTNAGNTRCWLSFLISSIICNILLTKVSKKYHLLYLEICLKWLSDIYN